MVNKKLNKSKDSIKEIKKAVSGNHVLHHIHAPEHHEVHHIEHHEEKPVHHIVHHKDVHHHKKAEHASNKETAQENEIKLAGKEMKVSKETLKLAKSQEIAMDFATKVYSKFDKIIKSIVLFGSSSKGLAADTSDIDLVIIIDDCSVQWDDELTAWYREELGKIVKQNPYRKTLHLNTTRLSTWWAEMIRGEPLIINIIRYGEPLIDFGGFFTPLKVLLSQGKIRSTPESIYITLGRAPNHLARSKAAVLNAIEGLYWGFVDSAHSALMAAKIVPPSPEHIPDMLKEEFVYKKKLKKEYVAWFEDIYHLAHRIFRNEEVDIKGKDIDVLSERADKFLKEMAKITDELIE